MIQFILVICTIFLTSLSFGESLKKSDSHFHLVNFLQNGEHWSEETQQFIPSSPYKTLKVGDRGKRIEAVLKRMDAANVSVAMISGMPFIKKWDKSVAFRSTYYLDSTSRVLFARDTDYIVALAIGDFLASDYPNAEEERKRLFPFVSGFNPTDLGAVDMVVKRIKEFPGLWEGIGEVMSRHDDLTNLSLGERPRGDHPSIHRLAHFAGTFHMPLSIHHNIGPISPGKDKKEPLYLGELVRLVDQHPNTTFIWCHVGISRRLNIKNFTTVLSEFLRENGRHKHVYIDISWVVFEDYIYDKKNGVDNREEWAKLILMFPHTFMIGSDAVANFGGYTKEMNKFQPLYETLRKKKGGDYLVNNLAHDNYAKMMLALREKRGGLGVVLPENYRYPEENFVNPTFRYTVKPAR